MDGWKNEWVQSSRDFKVLTERKSKLLNIHYFNKLSTLQNCGFKEKINLKFLSPKWNFYLSAIIS